MGIEPHRGLQLDKALFGPAHEVEAATEKGMTVGVVGIEADHTPQDRQRAIMVHHP